MENSVVMNTYALDLKFCRTCLRKADQRIDFQYQTILTNCFERSRDSAPQYPRFVCEECSGFLKKCQEFTQMYTEAQKKVTHYLETQTWDGELEIPSWLKRAPQQEDRSNIGPMSVGPYGTLMSQSSIPSSAMQGQFSADHMIQTQLGQDHAITQPPYPQFEPSAVQASYSQMTSSNSQQLQQLSPQLNLMQYNLYGSYQPQYQQQQQLQSPLISFGQPGMQHSTAQAVPLQPRSEPPAVARQLQTTGPIQPTPRPQCPVCSLQFASREHLEHHIRKHDDCKQFNVYREMFAHPEKGIEHLKDPNSMWCRFCRTEFSDEPSLDEHLNQHMKSNVSYCCDFCVLLFVDRNTLQSHLHSDHSEELWEFVKLNPHKNK